MDHELSAGLLVDAAFWSLPAAGQRKERATMPNAKNLTGKQRDVLRKTLQARFAENPSRHPGLRWAAVQAKLDAQPEKLWSLAEMEKTGGEPDVIGQEAGEFIFCDCSAESPAGRRSLCYDQAALDARKEAKPRSAALAMAAAMGIAILTEEQYRRLQELGQFDTKTSSWLQTPAAIRKLGGAIFADRRYNHVFVYHNGAASYYAARGFRGVLRA